jgi:hypothetical protein
MTQIADISVVLWIVAMCNMVLSKDQAELLCDIPSNWVRLT